MDSSNRRLHVARSFRSNQPGGPVVTGQKVFAIRANGSLDEFASHSFEPANIQPMDVAIDEPAGLIFLAGWGPTRHWPSRG